MNLRFGLRLVIALSLVTAPWSLRADQPACRARVRITSIDVGEASKDAPTTSVAQFIRALSLSVVKTAGLNYSIESVPYARAINNFRNGTADFLIASDKTTDGQGIAGSHIPIFFIDMTSYRRHSSPPRSKATPIVGMLNGMPMPDRYAARGYRSYYADSYDSLFRMLAAHHLDEVVTGQLGAAIYFNQHPDIREQVSAPALIERLTASVHLAPSLGAACLSLLSKAAETTRHQDLASLSNQYLPGIQTTDFFIPDPANASAPATPVISPAAQAAPPLTGK